MAMTRTTPSRADHVCRRRGLTLIEVTISMLVLAILLVASLSMLGSAAKARYLLAKRQLGPVLARQLMMEAVQNQYASMNANATFGMEPGENTGTRAAFNDVDDYDGWTECPPHDKAGNVLPNCTGWTRTVQVYYADPSDPMGTPASTDTGLKRVTVTVTSPNGAQTILAALRTRFCDQPAAVATQRTTWVNLSLQIGDDPAACRSTATTVLNAVQQP
jgi:MSHA pilin protein MshD